MVIATFCLASLLSYLEFEQEEEHEEEGRIIKKGKCGAERILYLCKTKASNIEFSEDVELSLQYFHVQKIQTILSEYENENETQENEQGAEEDQDEDEEEEMMNLIREQYLLTTIETNVINDYFRFLWRKCERARRTYFEILNSSSTFPNKLEYVQENQNNVFVFNFSETAIRYLFMLASLQMKISLVVKI